MSSSRKLMIAGLVLIAIALGSSGHGYWWLFGLLWALPHAGEGRGCGGGISRRRPERRRPQHEPPAALPDPTQDRHEAFRPGR
jgi:hypothetical protein